MVKEWIYIYFLGYGAGDSLDVNPFFKNVSLYQATHGIYISHNNDQEMSFPDIESFSENVKTLFQGFGQKSIITCNTISFLHQLSSMSSDDLSKQLQKVLSDYRTTEDNDEKIWVNNYLKKIFGKELLPYENRLALSVQICYILGIDTNRVLPHNWWKALKKCKNINNQYKNYYGAMLGKASGNTKALRCFPPPANAEPLAMSDYFAAWHRHKRAAKVLGTPATTLEQLNSIINFSGQQIGWDISTPTNRWFHYILSAILINPFFLEKQTKKFKKEIEILLCITELLIKHKNRLSEIYQYYAALRIHGVLLYLVGKISAAEPFINAAITGYQEISSTSGVIGTYCLSSLCNTITFCYGRNEFKLKAANNLQYMKTLIKQSQQQFYFLYFVGCKLFYIWGLVFGQFICKRMPEI